jgi:hypothetical protein
MKVDEIILEGPVWDTVKNTVKNNIKNVPNTVGNAFGDFVKKQLGPRSRGQASAQKDIDKWSKQVLQQWGTIEASLENSIGPLSDQTPDIQQKYADQLSKWLKTYFRLSNTDLTNYTISTNGEFNDDNILKYIKKAYAIRLSPDYLQKVSGAASATDTTSATNTTKTSDTGMSVLIPGKTVGQLTLKTGDSVEVKLMWVGPDGQVIKDISQIAQINSSVR